MPFANTPANQPFGPDWQLRALIARNGYGVGVSNDVAAMLNTFYRDLSERVASGKDLSNWQQTRLSDLRAWSGARLAEVMGQARDNALGAVASAGAAETAGMRAQAGAMRVLAGMPSRSQTIQIARFNEIARTADIGGVGFGDWWQSSATRALQRATATIQARLLEGKGPREVARAVIASDPAALTLSAMHTREIRTAVRTAMTAVTTHAANLEHNEMTDVINHVRFEAVLDARTSAICRAFDNKEFGVGDPKTPQPPLHPNCRSALVPVPDMNVLGLHESDLGARVNYDQWLRSKDEQTQVDVLGKARATLWRDGKVTLGQMIGADRKTLTLAQLEATLTKV